MISSSRRARRVAMGFPRLLLPLRMEGMAALMETSAAASAFSGTVHCSFL